jgi:branched-subunit amino acid transport protein
MNEFLLITGMALVTLAVRYPVLVLIGKIPMPDSVFRALRYVPPAVLAAIIAPGVLAPSGDILITPQNNALVASIVSIIVAWRTKNLLLTIVIGMAVLLLWRLVV